MVFGSLDFLHRFQRKHKSQQSNAETDVISKSTVKAEMKGVCVCVCVCVCVKDKQKCKTILDFSVILFMLIGNGLLLSF